MNPSVEIPLTAGWNLIGYVPEDAIVSIASVKDGATSSDAFETNASTRAALTYGPFGESEDVANPDKLGPTMFTDVLLMMVCYAPEGVQLNFKARDVTARCETPPP